MPEHWPNLFSAHFDDFLGAPDRTTEFNPHAGGSPIEARVHEGVFDGCSLVCTVGFSAYSAEFGGAAEVAMPVDEAADDAADVLVNALFAMADRKMRMTVGAFMSGLEAIDSDFVREFGKVALYFTEPYGVPDEFVLVERPGANGAVVFGLFISDAERAFLREHESRRFEQLLQEKQVDPFHLRRPSCL